MRFGHGIRKWRKPPFGFPLSAILSPDIVHLVCPPDIDYDLSSVGYEDLFDLGAIASDDGL